MGGGFHQGYAHTIAAEAAFHQMASGSHLHRIGIADRHNWLWNILWQGCFARYADSKTGNI